MAEIVSVLADDGEEGSASGASHARGHGAALALGALGVVFGDIGTSPLYALQTALHALSATPAAADVLATVSLIIWALILIVSVKYVGLVMRADNEGEGGILALLALVAPPRMGERLPVVALLGIIGAAFLFGDGAITPAISVLSAMEGLKVVGEGFAPYVLPLTLAVLLVLFALQSRGTGTIGRLFGPVMALWFLAIGALGLAALLARPAILAAFNPLLAAHLLHHAPGLAFAVFGCVFLALTGAEALYADMGHFGAAPIRRAWFALVFPALVLNYLGQGALLLANPKAADNPFFHLAPSAVLMPMVVLAACATVIASQALISGVFSMTREAIVLRLLPRIAIRPTSSKAYGQIYVPVVNWGLMVATLCIVLGFRSSEALASAYGIAVSATMLITTMLIHKVMLEQWRWPAWAAHLVVLGFALVDSAFLVANSVKILDGGWLPLAMGGAIAFLMVSWWSGTVVVQRQLSHMGTSFTEFMELMDQRLLARLPGTAIFVTRTADRVSPMLMHHLMHNRVLHENVILLTLQPTKRPRVPAAERLTVEELGKGFWRVTVRVGFMQRPDVPLALRSLGRMGYGFCQVEGFTYYISHESLVRRPEGSRLSSPVWAAYHLMQRLGVRASDYFHLPPGQVMEVGFRLEV